MYLRQERRFRRLYGQVRAEPAAQIPDFRIAPDQAVRSAESFAGAFASWSTALLCGPIVVSPLLVSGVV